MEILDGEILAVLKEYWGYDGFRPGQMDIIRSSLEGRDVLGILPTGGGKSICFQVPAMLRDGLALVVTPLIALMKDQVRNLNDRGIRAIAIHSGMTRREVDTALNNAAYGDFKFLYLSPERLNTSLFHSYLPVLNINCIVVDEAHCISQWGYDFRPEYLKIAQLRKTVDAPVIALTATATPEVAEDIMARLEFPSKNLVKTSFARPNLAYNCLETLDKRGFILDFCSRNKGTGIIYVRSRKMTAELASFLCAAGIKASFYHAGLTAQERSKRQDEWLQDKVKVMVCTNAFGMGIDKSDVRFVLHFGLPESIEAYFQEAGRAGRDGKESTAILLWNTDDCARLRQTCSTSYPPLEYIEDIYHKIHSFFGIAYEKGLGMELRLDFEKFCETYKFNRLQAWNAISYLGRCGHWTLMENVAVATKVQIIADRTDLYDIEIPYEEMRTVLEVLMRRYEGIFSFPVLIDEEYVAKAAGLSIAVLRQQLYLLGVQHIIRYIPGTESDIIYLMANRLYPKDVNLKPELYNMLAETSRKRTEAMISFVCHSDRCRSRILLEYFGQTESEDCGKCDVCRRSEHRSVSKREMIDDGLLSPYEI